MVRFLIIALTLCAGLPMALAEKFEARLSKATVRTGETFQLSFILNGNGKQFTPPRLDDFQVLMGPNESYQREWVNGNFSSNTSFSFYLKAHHEGSFEIGPARVKVDGKFIESDPVVVKVVKGSSSNTASQSNPQRQNNKPSGSSSKQGDPSLEEQINQNLFMKLIVDKKQGYVGEEIVATYKLYINAQIVNNQFTELPVFNGFFVKDVEIPKGSEITQEIVNGQRFQVATLKRVILFPQQSGDLEVPPLSMDLVVRVNERRRARNMMEQFFGTHRDVKVNVSSNVQKLNIKPLPAKGQPADFSGAVGNYGITMTVDKETLKVNEAVNLSVTIAGKGNLDLITNPGITFPGDFESYDPEMSSNIKVTPGGVSGKKTFDYVLIPRYSGSYQLEPISLSYFNPESGKYERTSTAPITWTVEPSTGGLAESQAFAAPRKEDVQILGKDIRFIKTGDANLRENNDGFYGTASFYALSASPVIGMSLAIMLLGFFRKRNSDEVGTRKRNAKGVAKRRLSKAQKLMAAEDVAFFDEIYKALYGYLSDRFAMSQSELNRDSITKVLEGQGVSETVIAELKRCLEDCEMVRFAPGAVRAKVEVMESAEHIISELEDELG